MTGMEHTIEKAADVIRAAIERQADIVADGLHLDVQGVLTPHWIAEALATNGLLSPAPLTEEWGVRWDDHDIWDHYLDHGEAARGAGDGSDPTDGTVVHRHVTDWETP